MVVKSQLIISINITMMGKLWLLPEVEFLLALFPIGIGKYMLQMALDMKVEANWSLQNIYIMF